MRGRVFRTEVGEVLRELREYFCRNRYVIILMGAFIFLVHGDKLFSVNNGIDTEKIIFEGERFYESWLGIGRQGLVFFKGLLGLYTYNPYFAGLLALLFFLLTFLSFSFLFEYVRGRDGGAHKTGMRFASFAFCTVVAAHPVITEQLYFSLQSAEITLSFTLLAVSLLCAHKWAERGSGYWFFPAFLILLPVFSSYQAMVPLYLFGAVAVCCLRSMCVENPGVKGGIFYLVRLAMVFLAGFLLNQIITALFFSRSGYLAAQMQWDGAHIWQGVRRVWSHVRDVLLGGGVFYSAAFFCLAFGVLVLAALWLSGKPAGVRAWNAFLLLALYASPFYLTLLMGERPVARAQLVLPFTTGFLAYLTGVFLCGWEREKRGALFRLLKVYAVCVCAAAVWHETSVTGRLYYSDAVRYQEDMLLAGNISRDVAKFTGRHDFDGTVVFVGRREAPGNCVCLKGDVMGQSLFAWDTEAEPEHYWSSSRITGFMHCMGAGYLAPAPEQAAAAAAAAAGAPCYPAEGSIFWNGNVLVVKLSGD